MEDTKKCPFCAETILAAAIVCKHCGRDLKPAVPFVPDRPKTNNSGSAILGCLVIGIILFMGCVTVVNNSPHGTSASSSSSSTARSGIDEANLSYITTEFAKQGARVEREPGWPNIINITLPSTVAMTITEREAKEMAESAASKLGSDAIVRIKTPAGQTLAKGGI